MKVQELRDRVEEIIGKLRIKMVNTENRVLETPHTFWEFTQKNKDLQDVLESLEDIKDDLDSYSSNEEVKKIFSEEEFEELKQYLSYLEQYVEED